MGNRFFNDRLKQAGIEKRRSMSSIWLRPHMGKFHKRHLSKVRRRAGRLLCRYGEDNMQRVERGLRSAEGECNWKGT